MKHTESIHIAVAETSIIVRSGIVSILKRLPDVSVSPIEITSVVGLSQCMLAHRPQVLIINPLFGGWFNVEEFKTKNDHSSLKIVSLLCSVTDTNLLKSYDEHIQLYDDLEAINKKMLELMRSADEEVEAENEAETLSQREKEIVCCVVRGMTNKEIAEQLFLSIHTVITHRRNIARKLQIHSPAGLTIYAIVNKLVELSEVKMNL